MIMLHVYALYIDCMWFDLVDRRQIVLSCLDTRLHGYATTDNKSKIYKHINSCEQFTHLTDFLQLNMDEPNTEQFDPTLFLLNNCHIIDRARIGQNFYSKKHSPSVEKNRNLIMALKLRVNYLFLLTWSNYIKSIYTAHACNIIIPFDD